MHKPADLVFRNMQLKVNAKQCVGLNYVKFNFGITTKNSNENKIKGKMQLRLFFLPKEFVMV